MAKLRRREGDPFHLCNGQDERGDAERRGGSDVRWSEERARDDEVKGRGASAVRDGGPYPSPEPSPHEKRLKRVNRYELSTDARAHARALARVQATQLSEQLLIFQLKRNTRAETICSHHEVGIRPRTIP